LHRNRNAVPYDPEWAASFYDEYGERAAAGLLKIAAPEDSELRSLLTRLELDLGSEPGAIDGGEHMLAVLRTT
jgi:hypothetical protein